MARVESHTVLVLGGELELRTPDETDAEAVLAMLRAAFDETQYLTRNSAEFSLSTAEYAAVLQRKVASETDLFVVALCEGRTVGLGTLTGSPLERFRHEVTVALVVAREAWGRGIGSALLDLLLRWTDAQGLVRISLEVDASNKRAIELYRSRGFETEGVLRARKKLGNSYVDNYVMARVKGRTVEPLPASGPERESLVED